MSVFNPIQALPRPRICYSWRTGAFFVPRYETSKNTGKNLHSEVQHPEPFRRSPLFPPDPPEYLNPPV